MKYFLVRGGSLLSILSTWWQIRNTDNMISAIFHQAYVKVRNTTVAYLHGLWCMKVLFKLREMGWGARATVCSSWGRGLIAQQTRDIEPMLVQCWPALYDVGPTLNQHLFNVSCLLGVSHAQVVGRGMRGESSVQVGGMGLRFELCSSKGKGVNIVLTLTTLNYFVQTMQTKGFFQFEIII